MLTDAERDALFACPACHGPVERDASGVAFVCRVCALRFRVEDGIPNFLLSDAEKLQGSAQTPK